MKYNHLLVLLVLSSFILIAGCNKNVKVGGKVTFSDDGSPVPCGKIYFENGNMSAVGVVAEDGTYQLGLKKAGDGLPPGEYKVHIVGAVRTVKGNKNKDAMTGEITEGIPKVFQLIDGKYATRSTSDLTASITVANPHCDFSVDRAQTKK